MQEEMHKFKAGSLKSSSGKKVKSRKQAIAIGLNESGQSKKKKSSSRKASAAASARNRTGGGGGTKAPMRRKRNKGRS